MSRNLLANARDVLDSWTTVAPGADAAADDRGRGDDGRSRGVTGTAVGRAGAAIAASSRPHATAAAEPAASASVAATAAHGGHPLGRVAVTVATVIAAAVELYATPSAWAAAGSRSFATVFTPSQPSL